MANKAIAQEQSTIDELVVDARFVMRSYERKDKDGRVIDKQEYVSFELIDPFNDEDFTDVVLKAKWDRYDDKNRLVRPDRVFGYMTYYAKKLLRTVPEIPVKVTIRPVSYINKKKEKVVYAGMFAAPTFVELDGERDVEVMAKLAQDNNIFGLLAGKALGITITGKVDNEDA